MNWEADQPVSEGTVYFLWEVQIQCVEKDKHDQEAAVCSQQTWERKSWLLGIPDI